MRNNESIKNRSARPYACHSARRGIKDELATTIQKLYYSYQNLFIDSAVCGYNSRTTIYTGNTHWDEADSGIREK